MFKVYCWKIIQLGIIGALCGHIASATTIYSFVSAPGATVNPGTGAVSVSAQVDFIVNAGQLVIDVYNTSVNTGSVITSINSIDWGFTPTYSTVPLPASIAYAGTVINLDPLGNGPKVQDGYTVAPGGFAQLESTNQRWLPSASIQITGGLELTTISGGNPNQTIIGAPNVYSGGGPGTGTYLANQGLVQDNPFVQTIDMSHPAQFTLALSLLQANEVVSRARLTWGTGNTNTGQQLELIPLVAPEPGTTLLVGFGTALVIAGILRRRKV